MKTLPVFGNLHAIDATIRPEGLDSFSSEQLLEQFKVDRVEGKPKADTTTLASTSIFSRKLGDSIWNESWTREGFDKALEGPPRDPEKYWTPLHQRRAAYGPEVSHRIYLARNCAAMAAPLIEVCGIDEVAIMATDSPSWSPGMLWRYLPLAESAWRWVASTGIDAYDNHGGFLHSLLKPRAAGFASLWINRHFMPFAGPIAMRPNWIHRNYKIATMDAPLSGFQIKWDQDPILRRAVRNPDGTEQLTIDAGFLTMAFWNRIFLNEGNFAAQVFYEYARAIETPLNLGVKWES